MRLTQALRGQQAPEATALQQRPHTLRFASFDSSVLTSAELARQPLCAASGADCENDQGCICVLSAGPAPQDEQPQTCHNSWACNSQRLMTQQGPRSPGLRTVAADRARK